MPGTRHSLRIPDALLDAARERTLIPFIGSGFSRNVDSQVPTGETLVELIATELGIDPRLLRIHSNGDWKLCAEYLYLARKTLGDALRELILRLESRNDTEGRRQIEKATAHLALADLDTPAIYTTNWDSWIERALQHTRRTYYRVRSSRDLASPTLVKGDADNRIIPWVIKFHGDFSQPETIVFKQTDYFRRMRFDDPLDIRLQADIYGHAVLFLGYSFGDPNIQYIWYRLAEQLRTVDAPRRSYLLTHGTNPVMEAFLKEHHIDVIHVSLQSIREDTENLLRTLAEAQRQ